MDNCDRHYALDEEGNVIYINKVDRSQRHLHIYKCPVCNKEMIAKLGTKRKWHFAHKIKNDCDYETYLHTLAEKLIRDWFNSQSVIPFRMMLPAKCVHFDSCRWSQKVNCKGKIEKEYNLKKRFYHCDEKEKVFEKDGKRYVADIFCHNIKDETDPLFIEVYVTHKCDSNKLNSGIKIIEVKIESEEDIEDFIIKPIKESDKVNYYGIHPNKIIYSSDFYNPLQKFILFVSGKKYIKKDNITCKNYDVRRGVFEVTIERDLLLELKFSDLEFHTIGEILAYRFNHNLKFCSLCKWQGYSLLDNRYICKLFKKCGTNRFCSENDTYKCRYYKFDKEKNERWNTSITKIEETGAIDIWSSTDWK